jgi:MOSC domain-containing protein YiiM
MSATPHVVAVAARATHKVSKDAQPSIRLVTGLGVEGDAHSGATVKHRSRVAKDPAQPNLRQVHLIHAELHEMLAAKGFAIGPADMGENILTRGLDLLTLPTGTRLAIGADAIIEVSGLRNPCHQLNGLAPGLMDAVIERSDDGSLVRKAGVMGIVIAGGEIRSGDKIVVHLPDGENRPLLPV